MIFARNLGGEYSLLRVMSTGALLMQAFCYRHCLFARTLLHLNYSLLLLSQQLLSQQFLERAWKRTDTRVGLGLSLIHI